MELEQNIQFDLRLDYYNRETLEAMQETLEIEAGKIEAKRYRSVDELFAENDAELAREDSRTGSHSEVLNI